MSKINYIELPSHIGIVGSRSFTKHMMGKTKIAMHINKFVSSCRLGTTFVSGGAIGVDQWARKAADQYEQNIVEFLPKRDIPIPARFFERNRTIVDCLKNHEGMLAAFIDVESWRGTSQGVEYAIKQEVPVRIFKFTQSGKYLGEVDNVAEYVYNYRSTK